MKKTILLSLLTVLMLPFVGCSKRSSHERVSSVYLGTMETVHGDRTYAYSVEIREVDNGYGLSRIVHLTMYAAGTNKSELKITGHDWTASCNWGRIFYGNYPLGTGTNATIAGYSSMVKEDSGNWKFEPCGYDLDHGLKPFTNEQILFALQELDYAVLEIRNPQHLVDTHFWDEKSQSCVMVRGSDAKPVEF